MSGSDQRKLLNAGYTIIRRDDHPAPRIKFKKKDTGDWRTHEQSFTTKAARDRHANELLKSSTIIED